MRIFSTRFLDYGILRGVACGRVFWMIFAAAMGSYADEPAFLQHMLNLQRFQALCQTGGAVPPVRVLIYGQSITGQAWSTKLVDAVRARHPGRSWVVTNLCISGNSTQTLIHTAETDVYPFNPDLIIFHDYGDTNLYQQLVEDFRARTTSDILLMNDHYVLWDSLSTPGIGDWDGAILPALALANGACMADIRTPWKNYLISNNLPYTALVADGLHPNAMGQSLLLQFMSVYANGPALAPVPDPYNCPRARRMLIPPAAIASGEWRVVFEGNRVAAQVRLGSARILVDGAPPSAALTGGIHGRSSAWPGSPIWPCLLKVGNATPIIPEQWTLRVESLNSAKSFQFSVHGSVTGPDGSGSTDSPFRSLSGRVLILPEDWWWAQFSGKLTNGMQFTWTSRLRGSDTLSGGKGVSWVDLVSNLSQGTHELLIQQQPGVPAITEIVVYNPAGRSVGEPGTIYQLAGTNGFALLASGNLQTSSNLKDWQPATALDSTQSNTNYNSFSTYPCQFYRLQP